MGESLRASLLSAYQAWELTSLVVGLGAFFIGLGVVFGATAYAPSPSSGDRAGVTGGPHARGDHGQLTNPTMVPRPGRAAALLRLGGTDA
jgi:hypothetical protein